MKPTRDAFSDALLELAEDYPEIVTLDADVGGSVRSATFNKKYPERAYNFGISEANMIGAAAGLALRGKTPFVSSFAVFVIGRAYQQVRDSICYSNANVKIVGTHAGLLTGEDGATHQSLEDISLTRNLPNMQVFEPADYYQAKAVIKEIVKLRGPCYVRLGRATVPFIYNENYQFKIGRGDILRPGTDLTLVASGATVHHALEAAEKLSAQNISAQVINLCSLKPVDENLIIKCANETKLIVTVEDHFIWGGLGSIVAELMAEHQTKAKLHRIGMITFGESGKAADLYRKYKLDAEGIVEEVIRPKGPP